MLPPPAHDSGLEWFAIPFPYGSFIRYSMPVLTGAFPDPISYPAQDCNIRIGLVVGAVIGEGVEAFGFRPKAVLLALETPGLFEIAWA